MRNIPKSSKPCSLTVREVNQAIEGLAGRNAHRHSGRFEDSLVCATFPLSLRERVSQIRILVPTETVIIHRETGDPMLFHYSCHLGRQFIAHCVVGRVGKLVEI